MKIEIRLENESVPNFMVAYKLETVNPFIREKRALLYKIII